jgi:hypothetical protein
LHPEADLEKNQAKTMKKPPEGGFKLLAEGAGFEPAVGY